MWSLIILSFTVIVLSITYFSLKKKYQYWTERNVVHLKPKYLIGNYGPYILQRLYLGSMVQKICKKFPNEPFIGAYYGTEPVIIFQDLDLIKLVTTKDFNYFNSRDISDHAHKEIMGKSVLLSYGDHWKLARQTLTPMFSSAKMKNMFYLVEKCAYNFEEYIENLKDVEMRDLMAEFTMDTIVSCAFGLELKNMGKNSGFHKIGDKFFNLNRLVFAIIMWRSIWPGFFYKFGLNSFPRPIYGFFKKMLIEVFEARGYKASPRNDFIDMLLTSKQNNSDIDDDFMIAQSAAMFLAGFETSANSMSFTLYELAKHPEIQEKVLREVDDYLKNHDNKLDYDCLNDLPYLDACMNEALRLYPVLGVITREVVKEYTLPSGLLLEKGLRVQIPAYHLQRHPDLFPDPDSFIPERFLPENKENIKPYSYLPFGEGPRNCLGSRFAKMQGMAGIITLLKKYKVSLCPNTPVDVVFEPKAMTTIASGGLWLHLEAREGWEDRRFAKKVV